MQSTRYLPLALVVFLLSSIEFLQNGMTVFAANPIMGEIGVSVEEYSIITALYGCVAVVAISKQYWLRERIGWRPYIISGLIVFVIGAFICAHSHDRLGFTIGRMVMALGGAANFTSARMLVHLIPPGPQRMIGFHGLSFGVALGSCAAPFIASQVVTLDQWALIFWVLIGLAVLAAIFAFQVLPTDVHPEKDRTSSSMAKVMLLACGCFTLLYITQRTRYDFYNDGLILISCAVLGWLAIFVFIRSEHKNERPLLHVREMMNIRFFFGMGIFALAYLVLGATNYLLPVFLQQGMGYTWEVAGHAQALGMLSMLVTWLILSQVMMKLPQAKKYFLISFMMLSFSGWLFTQLTPVVNIWWHIVPAIACYGCFVMMTLPITGMQSFTSFSQDDRVMSHAQQLKNMVGQLCTAFGTAQVTVFTQWRTTTQYDTLSHRFATGDPVYTELLQKLEAHYAANDVTGSATQKALGTLAQQLSQHSTFLSGLDYFWALTVLGVAGMVVMLVQRVFR